MTRALSWTGLLSHTGLLFRRWSLTLPSADWTRENCYLSENKKVRIECTYHAFIFIFSSVVILHFDKTQSGVASKVTFFLALNLSRL